ncbi:hypothetical protein [Quadrisphaera sp. INWT6]|uniref:hypothetical protein n=1 Tax=Quadrisphaera sp. INWT6 TaxID=2596917 RepID=UPI0019D6341E|nr:hypothetical protein [Quadrisphaera sp. INWT6]
MSELLRNLVLWDLHPERLVSDTFSIEDAERAYAVADAAQGGKVGITWPDGADGAAPSGR